MKRRLPANELKHWENLQRTYTLYDGETRQDYRSGGGKITTEDFFKNHPPISLSRARQFR